MPKLSKPPRVLKEPLGLTALTELDTVAVDVGGEEQEARQR